MVHKTSYNFWVEIFELRPRRRRFTDFQSRPCISSLLNWVSADSSIYPLLSRNIRIPIFRARQPFLSFSLLRMAMYQLRLVRARSLHTRETRCYHVCPNNSDHAFDSSMFPPAWRERRQRKKWSLGLRYLLIAVTSAPNCTPKPEGLPRPHPTPFPFVLLFFLPPWPEPRRSRFCLSLPYLASHGSQLRVLSCGLLDEPWLVRNSRSSSGHLRILIRVPKYRKVANLD